ncbi:MAG TPA: prepilin-type N-terminal cleavage/methylation domain-containing protein [Patescibacteria group bacterium]|nr:prepilin-type N-terminal cleavage/methylation domain-containing protein [Patescibacteria group bacterium]
MPKKFLQGFTLMNSTSESKTKGFTLIELLVVISIIGILTTLVSANLNAARSRARDAERKSDMRNISTALRLYFNDYGKYPLSNNSLNIMGCGVSATELCTAGAAWIGGQSSTIYMSILPKDPSSNQVYRYTSPCGGVSTDTYCLQACLENKSDTSGIATATNWCPSGWMFQITP